ncbi:MAG: response regulator [Candidatus Hodarchaeales archaeon]|jgi:two-component system chemotaxis response regulator CheY
MVNILIADDAKFMRMMLRRILESEGHKIIGEAASGEEVISLYAKLRPDLVTMDIVMPDPNGIECVKKIRNFDPHAKIVMVTALGQEAMVVEALKAGASDFVIKPFKAGKVIQSVDKVISKPV